MFFGCLCDRGEWGLALRGGLGQRRRRVHLLVVHHHLRAGGVRRVIELGLPAILEAAGSGKHRVTVWCGEALDGVWNERLKLALGGAEVRLQVIPAMGYVGEQREAVSELRGQLASALKGWRACGGGQPDVVWAHNLSLGRNLLLAEALAEVCSASEVPLVLHQHDWWFDQRWGRWPEMRRTGYRTLAAAAAAVFPAGRTVQATINQADTRVLEGAWGGASAWLPNPVGRAGDIGERARVRARRWLTERLGDAGPVWLLPSRLLRRKNVAEAMLLTRWLRPEAWLVTTGGPSSAAEQGYYDRLQEAVRVGKWRVRLGLLAGLGVGEHPPMGDLMAASEVLLMTSVQEGFGLPYLEAAGVRRPLVARHLPNVMPDLGTFGFHFPHGYDDIQVPRGLWDWEGERDRQRERLGRWRRSLPGPVQGWVEKPALLEAGGGEGSIAFSRLTWEGQWEVLRQPLEASWEGCVELNPWLAGWREEARSGSMAPVVWAEGADRWLGREAYGGGFWKAVGEAGKGKRAGSAVRVQQQFIKERLTRGHLFPLLWGSNP